MSWLGVNIISPIVVYWVPAFTSHMMCNVWLRLDPSFCKLQLKVFLPTLQNTWNDGTHTLHTQHFHNSWTLMINRTQNDAIEWLEKGGPAHKVLLNHIQGDNFLQQLLLGMWNL